MRSMPMHNIMKANSASWLLFSWQRSVTDLREKCARREGRDGTCQKGRMLAREREREGRKEDLGWPAGLYHFLAPKIQWEQKSNVTKFSLFRCFKICLFSLWFPIKSTVWRKGGGDGLKVRVIWNIAKVKNSAWYNNSFKLSPWLRSVPKNLCLGV